MLEKTSPDLVYKLFAVLGTLTVALAPYAAWQRLDAFETRATSLFEQHILAELDLQSLKQQFHALQRAVEAGRGDAGDEADYSPSQLRQMVEEAELLNRRIEESYTELQALEKAKRELTGDLKWLFMLTLLLTSAGMILAVFGLLGWFFHVRIFRERRAGERDS